MAINNQAPTHHNNEIEISLSEIIKFFRVNRKTILSFMFLGSILMGLYGKFTGPIYTATSLINSAKISGQFLLEPKIILSQLSLNSYFSKNTHSKCAPDFYIYKDEDYQISDVVKFSLTKDMELIRVSTSHRKKANAELCLDSILDDIQKTQKDLLDPMIQIQLTNIKILESQLKIKKFPQDKLDYLGDYLASFQNTYLIEKINELKINASPARTYYANFSSPVYIKEKRFPSLEMGLIFGLFLGSLLGILISFVRQITKK